MNSSTREMPQLRHKLVVLLLLLLAGWAGCDAPPNTPADDPLQVIAIHPALSTRLAHAPAWSSEQGAFAFSGDAPICASRSNAAQQPIVHVNASEHATGGYRLSVDDALWLSIEPLDIEASSGQPTGAALIYPRIATSTDMLLWGTSSGVEELRVLYDEAAPATARYRLRWGPSISEARLRGGRVELIHDERVILHTKTPIALDARGEHARVSLSLEHDADGALLTASVNTADLSYPIVVDPDWTFGPGWPQQAAVALNSIWLDGSNTIEGDVAVLDTIAFNIDDQVELTMGGDCAIRGSAAANRMALAAEASIDNDAAYNEWLEAGTVGGIITTPLALPLPIDVPAVPYFQPGTSAVNVTSGTTYLAAGDYGDVNVDPGEQLVFSGGAYNLASVTLSNGAKWLCAAPCEVRIANSLVVLSGVVVGDRDVLPASDFEIIVVGENSIPEQLHAPPLPVELGSFSQLAARIYAPNGSALLGQETFLLGKLVARDIKLDTGAVVADDREALSPNCEDYCLAIVGKCPNGPPSQAACVSQCEAELAASSCAYSFGELVRCMVHSPEVSCDENDDLVFKACAEAKQDTVDCAAACTNLDDANPCTVDVCACTPASCNPTTAVHHLPHAYGVSASDGNACNGQEVCDGAGNIVAPIPPRHR